ncbi:MAG: hypothetical protein HUU21_21090 [Polyangiaceae bacterium]|nr:hypothetical protein [Polyangiaceae bacterium]NUQ76043.1 hypothetical protein [Polyangiaceae bacterium]
MKLAPRLLLTLLPLLVACEKKPPAEQPAYGDPVGITMEASRDLPGFEVAIAVSKGIAVDPLVPPLSGLLHKALRACPDFVKAAVASPSTATQVAFTVEQGKTKDVAVSVKGAECITSNLTAQDLPNLTVQREAPGTEGAAPGKLYVVALLRFPGAPASPTESPKP